MILDITQLLDICISDKLIDMVISGQKNKSEDKAVKVRIRPVILKNEIEYQVSEFVGRKVLHSNHSAADDKKKIIDYMTEDFKQAQINMTDAAAHVFYRMSLCLIFCFCSLFILLSNTIPYYSCYQYNPLQVP